SSGAHHSHRNRGCGRSLRRPPWHIWSGIGMGVGIEVENLNAWYGKTQALFDVDLKVAANHATALIGPSGCGKSTFIRCLNRMHETIPDTRITGRVCIGELDAYNGTSPTQLRRRVGMVF